MKAVAKLKELKTVRQRRADMILAARQKIKGDFEFIVPPYGHHLRAIDEAEAALLKEIRGMDRARVTLAERIVGISVSA